MKLRQILKEIENSSYIQMFHGGNRWYSAPEVQVPSRGRYEFGVGINTTNNFETARKYAKGSNVITLLSIDKNIKEIDDVYVPLTEIIDFIKSVRGMKKRDNVISDLKRYSERTSKTDIPLSVFNNLVINHEAASGQVGLEITNFFVSKGADVVIDDRGSGEQWMIIFNPSIIKKYEVINPAKWSVDDYLLPKVN